MPGLALRAQGLTHVIWCSEMQQRRREAARYILSRGSRISHFPFTKLLKGQYLETIHPLPSSSLGHHTQTPSPPASPMNSVVVSFRSIDDFLQIEEIRTGVTSMSGGKAGHRKAETKGGYSKESDVFLNKPTAQRNSSPRLFQEGRLGHRHTF